MSFTVRDAVHADLPTIVAIYNASVPARLATADLHPVTVQSREAWFKQHGPHTYPLLVAVEGKQVIGWASLNVFFNGRAAYRHTAEISIYIHPQAGRKGLASALTDELIARCPGLKIKTLTAFIFGHNEPSLGFFKKRGFQFWGRLPRIADLDGVERDLDIYGLRL